MDLISHLIFAVLLNSGMPDVWLFLGAIFPDIDKAVTYPRKHFFSHLSRTLFTELPMESLFIAASIIIMPQFALGLISHYVLDYLSGETKPFHPFFGNTVNFDIPWKFKIFVSAVFWIIGWILVVRVWSLNITGL